MLVWAGASTKAATRVVIVSSDTTAAYADATQALMGGLERAGVARLDIRHMSVAEWNAANAANAVVVALNPQAFVALGTEAASVLARAKLKSPMLSALIPRSSFERVLRESGRKASAQFNVLYLDQPLQRQLAMIRLALPQARRIAVLWGPDSWSSAPTLRALASANGLSLQEARLDPDTPLFDALQKALDGSHVLLAQADPQVFNGNSIQNILMTTIRHKVPLIAFSPAYVRAGALLAIYSTPTQVGTQAAQWVLDALANRLLLEQPMAPDDFEISINPQVARVLNLSLDAAALQQALKRREQP